MNKQGNENGNCGRDVDGGFVKCSKTLVNVRMYQIIYLHYSFNEHFELVHILKLTE